MTTLDYFIRHIFSWLAKCGSIDLLMCVLAFSGWKYNSACLTFLSLDSSHETACRTRDEWWIGIHSMHRLFCQTGLEAKGKTNQQTNRFSFPKLKIKKKKDIPVCHYGLFRGEFRISAASYTNTLNTLHWFVPSAIWPENMTLKSNHPLRLFYLFTLYKASFLPLVTPAVSWATWSLRSLC